jgi:alpha-L-arabinofuranosidase
MKQALRMDELVTRHAAIMDKYDPKNEVAMTVDEWGGWYEVEHPTNPAFLFQQNTISDAMIAGTTLNIFNNHARRVKMANLAQAVNVLQAVILTEGNKLLLTPTYHVMEMYTVHQDAARLPSEVSTPGYVQGLDTLPAAERIQAYNSFAEPQRVRPLPFNGATVREGNIWLTMPPASVIVLTLK